MVFSFFKKKGEGAGDEVRQLVRKGSLLGLIPAAASAVLFLLTEDMKNRMTLADKWTVPMLLILAVNGAIAYFTCVRKAAKQKAKTK